MAERIEIKRGTKKKSGYEVEKRDDGFFYSEYEMKGLDDSEGKVIFCDRVSPAVALFVFPSCLIISVWAYATFLLT